MTADDPPSAADGAISIIVIPCYNELATIGQLLRAVRTAPGGNKEVIVIDDGSTDGTREALKSALYPLVDNLILHEVNRGKSAALRPGFAAATGDIVIIQDADLEYEPNESAALVAPIPANRADVVFGSRFMGSKPHRSGMLSQSVPARDHPMRSVDGEFI